MLVDSITVGFSPILYCYLMPCRASELLSLQPMFSVGLHIQICVHNISIIILVCACVHRDWCFEAFVDVKIPGAGDDLLSSAARNPRVCAAQEVALRIAALAHLQEKAPRGATCPGRRGKVLLFLLCTYVFYNLPVSGIANGNEAQQIQNKQAGSSSQPGPKPKTTTRVRVLQPARFGYAGANGTEAHQIQNKQVDNSSLYQTKPKTTRLKKRVSCAVVLMASTMLHEKCCNTVLQIGDPIKVDPLRHRQK